MNAAAITLALALVLVGTAALLRATRQLQRRILGLVYRPVAQAQDPSVILLEVLDEPAPRWPSRLATVPQGAQETRRTTIVPAEPRLRVVRRG